MMVAGETCDTAITIPANGIYDGNTMGAASDFAFRDVGNCQGTSSSSGLGAPDHVFQVTIPSNNRLSVELNTADGGPTGGTWDSILNLIPGPLANCGTRAPDGGTEGIVCLAGADNGNPERVTYVNTATTPLDTFILVKGWSTGFGLYRLTTTTSPPSAGDLCSNAIALVSGMTLTGENFGSSFNDYGAGTNCGSPSSGADRLYSIDVPAGQRLRVTVTPSGLDTSLSLLDGLTSCDSQTCVANGGTGGTSVAEIAYYTNTTGATRTLYVKVDSGSTSSGTYSISAVVDTAPVMGDTCVTPTPLVAGMTLMNETTEPYNPDYSGTGTGCTSASNGPDKVYSIVVPSGDRLTTTVTPATGFDTSISIVAGPAADCTARICAATGTNGGAGAADTAVYFNGSAQPVTVFVIVDSTSVFGNSFSISATLTTPAAGEACTNPIVLDGTTGTAVTGGFTYAETLSNASNEYAGTVPGCASGSFSGGDKVYALDTPAGQRTILIAEPDAGASVSLSLLANAAACNAVPRQCINGFDQSTVEQIATYNFTTGVERSLVIVDSASTSQGHVQLTALVDTPPAGEVCANAGAPITTAGTVSGTTIGYFNDYGSSSNNQTGCVGGIGPDRVHAIEVPSLTRMTAVVQPDAGYNVAVDLIAGQADCIGRRICASSANASSTNGVAETVTFKNTAAALTTVLLSVDSVSTAATGRGNYDVTVSYAPVPAGDVCQNVVPITMSGTLMNETTTGYDNDIATPGSPTSCGGFSNTGADKVYSVTIPAGMTLSATVTPATGFDPGIYLSTTCSASITMCLAGSDSGGAGTADSIMYTNSTTAAINAFLVIDRYTSGTPGDYSLTINIQ